MWPLGGNVPDWCQHVPLPGSRWALISVPRVYDLLEIVDKWRDGDAARLGREDTLLYGESSRGEGLYFEGFVICAKHSARLHAFPGCRDFDYNPGRVVCRVKVAKEGVVAC